MRPLVARDLQQWGFGGWESCSAENREKGLEGGIRSSDGRGRGGSFRVYPFLSF